MEPRSTFAALPITQIILHLTAAAVELYVDDITDIQIMAAGDSRDMAAITQSCGADTLTLEQSATTLVPSPGSARWLQVTVRIPRSWWGKVDIRTTSGSVTLRGLKLSDLTVETLAGAVSLTDITCQTMKARSMAGAIWGESLSAREGSFTATAGSIRLQALAFRTLSTSTVGQAIALHFSEMFTSLKAASVSGDICVELPSDKVDAALRSVSGRIYTTNVSLMKDAASIRATTVSGNMTINHIES